LEIVAYGLVCEVCGQTYHKSLAYYVSRKRGDAVSQVIARLPEKQICIECMQKAFENEIRE
jgi:hypothetical protein